MQKILIVLIKGYRSYISPLFLPSCRFQPTCSQYALQAIQKFGAVKGSWLAIKRIGRCHPFHPGGYDPVPNHRDIPTDKALHDDSLESNKKNN